MRQCFDKHTQDNHRYVQMMRTGWLFKSLCPICSLSFSAISEASIPIRDCLHDTDAPNLKYATTQSFEVAAHASLWADMHQEQLHSLQISTDHFQWIEVAHQTIYRKGTRLADNNLEDYFACKWIWIATHLPSLDLAKQGWSSRSHVEVSTTSQDQRCLSYPYCVTTFTMWWSNLYGASVNSQIWNILPCLSYCLLPRMDVRGYLDIPSQDVQSMLKASQKRHFKVMRLEVSQSSLIDQFTTQSFCHTD